MELVGLASDLAKLSRLPQIDSSDSLEAGSNVSVDEWSSGELASKLCLWTLEDVLRRSGSTTSQSSRDLLPSRFQSLLSTCFTALSETDDLAELVNLVAFDNDIADALGLECRLETISWCLDSAAQVDDDKADLPSSHKLKAAHSYVTFLSEIAALRDPFTFTKLPDHWARAFDVASGAFVLGSSDSSEDVCAQCFVVLGDMIADEEPAYFVCQAYMCTRQLVAQWEGGVGSIPGLAQVYSQTLCRVVGEASGDDVASSDETMARRVVAVAEPPLELCSFDYGDSVLGEVLVQFQREFGADLLDIVHGKHPGMAVVLGSAAKLALLDLLARFCSSDLHRVVSEADDIAERAARKVDEIGASDFLQLQLLADKLWGFALPDSNGRDYGQ
ncbi:hypothetical protein GGI21_005879, partial [Coemansia aciculifera]